MPKEESREPYFIGLPPEAKKEYAILKGKKILSPHTMQARLVAEFLMVLKDAKEAHKNSSKVDEAKSIEAKEVEANAEESSIIQSKDTNHVSSENAVGSASVA